MIEKHAIAFVVCLVAGRTACGIVDEDNMGRWEKPTTKGPDKDVPGFLVNLGPTGARAMLAHGRLEEEKALADSWSAVPETKGLWSWPASYQCAFLCEYYLKTQDEKVLPAIKGLVEILYTGQVQNEEDYKEAMHGGRPQARNFLRGGFGHSIKVAGYGTMSITTLMAMLAWELAEDCGVELKQPYVDLGYACIRKHTHPTGYTGYRFGGGAYSPVGRQGLSILVHGPANVEHSGQRFNDG